ncbi:TolC family outer membrane protein [Pectobacterium carotovorum]|uniref:TolC family outer membrane protein n=1 Tax=Pectobacterium carotovorum TaxID=554 RepID=UPI001CF2060E|nr:TolC family outer membrane protein [Pectobacterium carotovorum]MCA6966798.1 TolC family outer membrane protein [Pectobacterium carotovorum]MCH4989223.1 TolC family outer membrane protein [Pectobacterium carotovorum]
MHKPFFIRIFIRGMFFPRNRAFLTRILRHHTPRCVLTTGLALGLTCGLPLLYSPPTLAQAVAFDWSAAPTEQQVDSLDLKQAILRAFARNPQIAQASAQIRVGEADLRVAQSAWFPQIGLSGNVGRSDQSDTGGTMSNNSTAGLTLKQLLYDFGKTGGSIDEQHSLSDAYRYQLYGTMTTVGQQTLLTYLKVKRYQELSQAAERNITSLSLVKDTATLRAEAGLSTQSDILQAETRIAGMRATLEQYRALERSSLAQLSVLTGVLPTALPDLPRALLQQKITLKALPYQQSNAVLSAQSKQEASRHRIRQAEAQHFPTIAVQAGRTRYETDRRNYWDDQLQLVVEAPLYQGGAVSARVDAASGTREAAQAEVEAAKLDMNQKASTAYADLIGAQQREKASQQQITSATYTRNVYQDEYKLSKRSLNDLLSVEQDVLQAETSRIGALYDGWEAAVNYAAAVDNLLDILGIERHETTGETLPSL